MRPSRKFRFYDGWVTAIDSGRITLRELMQVRFELHKRGHNHQGDTLVHCLEEECHIDRIERRAKMLLWTLALEDRQDLVIVRRASDGGELFRRAIGTVYRARAVSS